MPARGAAVRRPLRGAPAAAWEQELWSAGYRWIAGLDEAGRGSWAGPLVAAAVILPFPSPDIQRQLGGLRDSKQLAPAERERLREVIQSVALGIGVGIVSAASVDLLGLTAAGHLAMERALRALPVRPDYLLIDAFTLHAVQLPQRVIVFGDSLCLSIAAASVVAKVERDRLLRQLAPLYPAYGFDANKGYGTPAHARALEAHGPTPEHRRSYEPVQRVIRARQC